MPVQMPPEPTTIRQSSTPPTPSSTAAWVRWSRSERVREIVDAHPTLNVTVVTNIEASRIADRVAQIAPKGSGECVSLRGYGAIRNMGLACAAVLGHDAVIFVDDDETVIDADLCAGAADAPGPADSGQERLFLRPRWIAACPHRQSGHLPSVVDQAHRVQPLDEKGALGYPYLTLQLRVRRPYGPACPRVYPRGIRPVYYPRRGPGLSL